jgi:hypothetical protein
MSCGYHRYWRIDNNTRALENGRRLLSRQIPPVFIYSQHHELNMPFDISKAREHFPALKQDQVFLDNAGGSQTLGEVIES